MTFIRKHKWTLIVLCALVVLWTVMEVTQGLLTQYTSSLREQLPALRNQGPRWKPLRQRSNSGSRSACL